LCIDTPAVNDLSVLKIVTIGDDTWNVPPFIKTVNIGGFKQIVGTHINSLARRGLT
jgi:hypothetical protein